MKYVFKWILLYVYFIGSLQLYGNANFYLATELFHAYGDSLSTLPQEGFAISVKRLPSDESIIQEERVHYENGVELSTWIFFYLEDGRLHRKVELNKEKNSIYEEIYFYTSKNTLWTVFTRLRNYLFTNVQILWQEADTLNRMMPSGTHKFFQHQRKSKQEFVLNALAESQIEEIWKDGTLVEVYFYKFGKIQKKRYMRSSKDFDEIIYYDDNPVVKRIIQNNVVIGEESLDG